jgi:nitroimidazol reductase NimA-like FMN-containing flavoprotein (pyridoxamine 5'-phosphate oxidase superfamily)
MGSELEKMAGGDGAVGGGGRPAPNVGPRSRVRRHPERARPDLVEAVLRAGHVAHVAFVVDGQPVVLPFTYHYEDGALYLHGAPASRAIRALGSGMPVCVEVLLVDGLVASREAKKHSMNYRGAVVFGCAEKVIDLAEKRALFERMTARYFPGRAAGQDYHPASEGHLKSADVLRVRIEEWSGKARSGSGMGEHDNDPDYAFGSAFVVELPGMDG